MKIVSLIRNGIGRLAKWYAEPTGLVSLVFIAAAIGCLIAGLTTAAIAVTLGWVAVMVPHKLTRVQRDWQTAVNQQGTSLRNEVASVEGYADSLVASVSGTPTVEEIRVWQESVEVAQAESNQTLLDRIAMLEAQLKDPWRDEVQAASMSSEVQALSSLYNLLDPELPLPSFGDWALSAEAAVMLGRAIIRTEPDLIVEAGSGTSTVVAALALAKVGGGRIVSLEHDRNYAIATRKLLSDRGLEKYATVLDCSLVDYQLEGEQVRWYDIAEGAIDTPIQLLLIDGPPRISGTEARFPAIPLLHEHLLPSTNVLIGEPSGQMSSEGFNRWDSLFNLFQVDQTNDGTMSVLRFAAEPTH